MGTPRRHAIGIVNRSGAPVSPVVLRAAVVAALERHASAPARIALLLATDEEVAELNLRFRGVEGPTDVLSFPAGDAPAPPGRRAFLGDVAVAVPFAARQAEARGVPRDQELAYLAVHGALHLLGYDDRTEAEAAAMAGAMSAAAVAAGLPPEPAWSSLPQVPR